jgi:CDP-diacylglycerol--serine O-phosphatidyltransferase
MLPALITLLNAIFGFISIGCASKGAIVGTERFFWHKPGLTYFAVAGYSIFIAMIFDMLDGRVARLSKSTSDFGGQLDSLCDVISFGVAPAFLMLRVVDLKLATFSFEHPAAGPYITKFVWLSAAIYVCCAAIRLARFNVENEEDESAHMAFWGLPSPAAAGVVASLVIFHQDLLPDLGRWIDIYNISENAIIYADNAILAILPFMTLGAAILMVSRIKYSHVFNQYFKGKKPFEYLIYGLGAILLVMWNLQLMLMVCFCGFAIWGFARWLFVRQSQPEPESEEQEEEE